MYDKFILATTVVDLIDIHVFLVGSQLNDIPNPPFQHGPHLLLHIHLLLTF